jgi:5'-3' exonuclease
VRIKMSSKVKKLGLFDLDIFVFQAAASCTKPVHLTNGNLYIFKAMDADEAIKLVRDRIDTLIKELKLDKAVLCITDKVNWRKEILPTYKFNRNKSDKPEGLDYIKEALKEFYEVVLWPTLEADDVMGILATDPNYHPEYRKIIISEDKDMKTIPCWLFNPAKDFEPYEVSEAYANHFHLLQTLAGDVTDGYVGCPSIGMDTAAELFKAQLMFEQYEKTFKSGVRKGETVLLWGKVPSPSAWATVVSCYVKAGLSESDAIVQAQVARICRDTEYNFKEKEVCPWLPH